jgi:hypothetical protein
MSNLRNFGIAFAAENSAANRIKNGDQRNGLQKEKPAIAMPKKHSGIVNGDNSVLVPRSR